jgi:hypothetical protein
MSTVFNWNIVKLECKPTLGELTDVVVTVHWRCEGVNGDASAFSFGGTSLEFNEESTFVPYQDLTKEQVLAWLWDGPVNKQAVEDYVENEIQDRLNPKVVAPPLPW